MNDMHNPIDAEKLDKSTTFKTIARLSMIITPILFAATLWVGSHWLNGRFDEQSQATMRLSAQVSALPNLRERVVVLETKEARSRVDRQEFQKQMIGRMDRMQDAIVQLSNTVAGLTATIKDERSGR